MNGGITDPDALIVSSTEQNSQLPSLIMVACLVDLRTIATDRIWFRPIVIPFSSQFHISLAATLCRCGSAGDVVVNFVFLLLVIYARVLGYVVV